jgi:uncharacterized protein (DUF305 family)
MISLALATTAKAAVPGSHVPVNAQTTESQTLVAQFVPSSSPFYSRQLLTEMIIQRMKMADMAQEAMQSKDPEVKKMAQEMITSSTADLNKMMSLWMKQFQFRSETFTR